MSMLTSHRSAQQLLMKQLVPQLSFSPSPDTKKSKRGRKRSAPEMLDAEEDLQLDVERRMKILMMSKLLAAKEKVGGMVDLTED